MTSFDHGPTDESYEFLWSSPEQPYLTRLRAEHQLDKIVAGCRDDYERIRAVCKWVHGLWEHHGYRKPKRRDPLSILREAAKGKRFRCVEYSEVLSGCLTALAIPARTLGLKTRDVQTRRFGAGHVVTEAYARDTCKWIFADAQRDMIPVLDGAPLNAVEFQEALAKNLPGLGIATGSGVAAAAYFKWIGQYLFYFDVRLDNRIAVPNRSRRGLMLVPIGTRKPRFFQWMPMWHLTYTHSVRAFYPRPK